MVKRLIYLMLEGETYEKVLQEAWNKMQELKKLALEDIGKRLLIGESDDVDFDLD
jgi:hypothetical protein